MKISENSHKLFADFFQTCGFCQDDAFPKVEVYAKRGAWILTNILFVDGITLGKYIFVAPKFVWRDHKSKLKIRHKLIAHELVHVIQYQQFGFWRFIRKYIGDFWKIFKQKEKWNFKTWVESYLELPQEIEARHIADEFIDWLEKK